MTETTQPDAEENDSDPRQKALEGGEQTPPAGDPPLQSVTRSLSREVETRSVNRPDEEPAVPDQDSGASRLRQAPYDEWLSGVWRGTFTSGLRWVWNLGPLRYFGQMRVPAPTTDDPSEVTPETDAGSGLVPSVVRRFRPRGTYRRKFRVKGCEPPYIPDRMSRPILTGTGFQSDVRAAGSGHNQVCALYIAQTAFEEIQWHIGWGKDTPANLVEQGGILLGDAFVDEEGRIFGIVNDIVAGELAQGTAAYLEISHESWKAMLDRVDHLQPTRDDAPILGWYHTHPGLLDVFMSGTDRNTQRRLFGLDWQFAIVLNPQRMIWRVFRGADAQECRGCAGRLSVAS